MFPYIQCGALQSLTVYGATTIDMSGASITTEGFQLYNGAVTLTTDAVLSSTSGSITFASTLNGTAAGVQALGLTAGTGGNVVFTGAVGGDTRLGAITISSANDVTAAAITAASLTQTTGQGTTTLNGLQNYNTAAGLNVVTDTISLQNAVTTTLGGVATLNANNSGGAATGTLTIGADGIINSAGAVNLTGATGLTQTAGATIDAAGDVSMTATTGGLNVNAAVTTTSSGVVTMNAAAGTLTIGADGIINSAGAVNLTGATGLTQTAGATIDAAGDVSMTATTGGLNVNAAVTTTSSGVVTMNAAAGTLTITALGDVTSDGAVNLNGANEISTAGDVTTTGDLVNYNSATTLTGGVLVNSTSGSATGGAITFGSTLNGAQSLGLTAGTGGNVVFTGDVGGTTRLGAMTISSANNVTAAAIKAASLTQASGQGITALNGLEDFDTAAGLNIVTDTISLQNTVRTTSGGGVTFNANNLGGAAAGTLTIGSDGGITSSGNVTLIGNQGVTLGGDILVGDSNTPANLALGNNLQTGAIHQVSGRLIVSGITTIDPVGPAGNVFLFSPENDFVGAVNVLNANGISLFDKNTLFLDQAQTSGGQVFQAVGRISTTGTGGFTTSSSSAGILLYSTGGGVTLNDGTTFNSNLTQIVLANEEGFVNNGLDGSAFTGLSQIFSTNEFLNFPSSPNAALSGFYPRYNILPTVSTGSDLASAGLFSVTFSGGAFAANSMAYRDTFAQNCTPYEYFTFVSTISNMTSIPTPGAAVPMYLPPQGAVSFGANIQKNSKASKQSTPSGTSTKSQPWIQLRDAEQI